MKLVRYRIPEVNISVISHIHIKKIVYKCNKKKVAVEVKNTAANQ